jgi:pimeloyl-ACP methyl ester carboxylesterase
MTDMRQSLTRGGVALRVDDAGGAGLTVIFQHGLCGDARQTAEAFPNDPRYRRITLECRGHGASEPGEAAAFSIATFTDDLAALIEAYGNAPLVVGGISMGAAIGLRLAVRRPELVSGLILARPAWVTRAAPPNMAPNGEVGRLLAATPSDQAREIFLAGETAHRLAAIAPDNLASLTGFFAREPQAVTAALLQAIASDGPGVSEDEARAIAVPTLIIGHGRDAIHPLAHAEALAALIPNARLRTITAKADDRLRYIADFHEALVTFLQVSVRRLLES